MNKKELKLIEEEIESLKFCIYEILDKVEHLSKKVSALKSESIVERTVDLQDVGIRGKLKFYLKGEKLVNAEFIEGS